MSAKIPGGKPTDDTKKKPAERRRNRTNYRCSKCGQPKRGHVCPYQPRVVKDPTAPAVPTRNAAVQVEMDERLAVRHLSLAAQGYPESYGEIPPPPPPGAPPTYAPGGSGASPTPGTIAARLGEDIAVSGLHADCARVGRFRAREKSLKVAAELSGGRFTGVVLLRWSCRRALGDIAGGGDAVQPGREEVSARALLPPPQPPL